MSYLIPLLFLVACGPSSTGDSGDTGSPQDTADTASTTDWSQATDEEVIRALIDGTGPALQSALHQVAWNGGFPVHTGQDTWLFVVESDGQSAWSLAGDFDGWTPEAMTQADGFFWAEKSIASPAGQPYKFTHDTTWVADRWARSYEYDTNGQISFVKPPTDRPRIDRWPDLQGQGLLPRDLRVLVPAGTGPWPVLYAQDGQNLFDPNAIWGGWHLQDAVAALDAPILVVGIDITANRLDEYAPTVDEIDAGGSQPLVAGGEADAYAALVEQDIRPHIEAVYGSTGLDGVLGSSMGGLVSLYIALQYPNDFDFAASMSGTLGWGRFGDSNPTVEEDYVAAGIQPFTIYVDSGGDDGGDGCTDPDLDGFPEDDPNDSDNYCMTRHFADAMATLGYVYDDNLFHWWEQGATHDEVHWAARVGRPLGIFDAMR